MSQNQTIVSSEMVSSIVLFHQLYQNKQSFQMSRKTISKSTVFAWRLIKDPQKTKVILSNGPGTLSDSEPIAEEAFGC